MIVHYAIVAGATLLVGAWSIPIGLLLGLPPLGVYVAAVAASLVLTGVVLIVGGRSRDAAFARWLPGVDEKWRSGRAVTILERWGVPGLAVLGGVLLGPSVTLAAALVLDVPRRRFAAWYAAGTVAGFALLTVLWQLIV